MQKTVLSLLAVVLTGLALGGFVLSQDSEAPAPERIAFVDVQRVFNEYWRKDQIEQSLDARADALETRIKAQIERVEELRDELATLNSDSDEYATARREVQMLTYSIKLDEEEGRAELGRESVRQKGLLYKDIVKEVQAFGESEGYAAVLVDTPLGADFEKLPAQDLESIMAMRGVLWSDERLDVTQDIIDYLNAGRPPR